MTSSIHFGYADTALGQIHYREAGSGPPVIMFHGCPLSSAIYDEALPELGNYVRAIAPDIPGYGSSTPPPGPLPLPDYAERLYLMMDALGLDKVPLIGYHTGAGIAIIIAVNHPERVNALLIMGAPLFEESERHKFLVEQNYLEPFPLSIDGSHLTWLWNRYRLLLGEGATVDLIHKLTTEFIRHATRYDWAYRAAFEFDGEPWLPKIACPTFYLLNNGDMLASKNEQAVAMTPNAEGKITEGSHGPYPLRYPDTFVRETIDFLKRVGYIK